MDRGIEEKRIVKIEGKKGRMEGEDERIWEKKRKKMIEEEESKRKSIRKGRIKKVNKEVEIENRGRVEVGKVRVSKGLRENEEKKLIEEILRKKMR